MIKQKTLVWGLAVLGLLLVSGATALWPVDDSAAQTNSTDRELQGYAWSSNIGWISFNSDHPGGSKVTIKPDGKFVGYAWSPHIGWINFGEGSDTPLRGRGSGNGTESGVVDPLVRNPDDPRGSGRTGGGGSGLTSGGGSTSGPRFRSGVVLAKTGQVTGWARACSVFADGCTGPLKNNEELGDWDGWIGMSGSWSSGVRLDGNDLTGYAWGAENLGWVDFSGVSIKTDDIPTDLAVICSITHDSDTPDAYTGSLTSSVSGGIPPYTFTWEIAQNVPENRIVYDRTLQSTSWSAPFDHYGSLVPFTLTAYLTVIDDVGRFVDSQNCGSVTVDQNTGGDDFELFVSPGEIRVDRHDLGFPALSPAVKVWHDSTNSVDVCLKSVTSSVNQSTLNQIAGTDYVPRCLFFAGSGSGSSVLDDKPCNQAPKVSVSLRQNVYFRILIPHKLQSIYNNSPYNATLGVCGSNEQKQNKDFVFYYTPAGSFEN